MGCNHFANLLSHRSVKDSFNRKLTTIGMKRIYLRHKGQMRSELISKEERILGLLGAEAICNKKH